MNLAANWELWNWSQDDTRVAAVILMLYGAYAVGWARGRRPDETPMWIQLGIVALICGVLMIIGLDSN